VSLFEELKRRNVLRVGTAYIVSAWLIIQVVETIFPAFGFGAVALRNITIVLAIGFVPTVVFAWVFELTPEGLRKDEELDHPRSVASGTARKLDRLIMAMLALALGYFAFDKFVLDPARHRELVEDTTLQTQAVALQESYGDRSIAVLPFVNLSSDPEQEYFSDGLAEELLNLLAKVPDLRVISRSSAFRFRGKEIAIPSVAEQLNVANIVEGSVRKAGNRLRIAVQLIEARSDTHIWSEIYDLELTAPNIFDTQAQIANRIAQALNTVLLKDDRERINRDPTQNLEAYEAYLMGRHTMATRTRADLERASEYFTEAVELDPEFALAWVGLADANLLLANYGAASLDSALAKAGPALSIALSLNDEVGAAYTALGLSSALQNDPIAAERAYQRAIEVDPSYATSYHWYADLLINSFGEAERAIPLLEKARTLDPLSPVIIITLGEALSWGGDVAGAIRYFLRALEIEPDFAGVYVLTSLAYLALGDDARAEYWIDQGADKWADEPGILAARAFLHRYRGEEAQALQVARQMWAIAPRNNVSLVTLVSFGHFQEAMETVAPEFPELSCEAAPILSPSNIFQAMNLSLALQDTGHRDCANRMLASILAYLNELPRQGRRTFGFLDSEIYARQGHLERALDALEEAIDAGVRIPWWSQVRTSPHTIALRESPRFKMLMEELEADMSAQLAQLREMEANGALPPAPE
jgi:adenylate cyclase